MRKRILSCALFCVFMLGVACSGAVGQDAENVALTREKVVAFVEEAVQYAQGNGKEQALAAFMDRNGAFVRGELYIYAYDFDGTVIAHGGQPELVGKNLIGMTDANGVQVIKELITLARQGSGWLDYLWPNPAHGNIIEPKAGYVMKVDDTWFLGSGLYEPEQ